MKADVKLDLPHEIYNCAESVWDYLAIRNDPATCDGVFVLGRDDFKIPEKALELYNSGMSLLLFLLGGRGRLSGSLTIPESEAFEKFLSDRAVPMKALLKDTLSTNTGENIDAGLELLRTNAPGAKKIIIVTHAPHARRALASVHKRTNSIKFISCPDDCKLPQDTKSFPLDVLLELTGELDRLQQYPAMGYIEEQVIPANILNCHKKMMDFLIIANGD